MTEDKDFKRVVRDRAAKTGESYAAARRQLAPGDKKADLVLARDWLASMLERFWAGFRPGLRGLTDDEYLWEPVPGCPTIRRQPDGTYRADHQFPIQGAATIAQRLCWAAQLTVVDTNQRQRPGQTSPKSLAMPSRASRCSAAPLRSGTTRWPRALRRS